VLAPGAAARHDRRVVDVEEEPPRGRVGLVAQLLGLTGIIAFAVTIAVAVVVVFLLGAPLRSAVHVFAAEDGDLLAAGLSERVVAGIADDIEPSYDEPADAEAVVQRNAVQSPRLPTDVIGVTYDVLPVAWEGSSGDDAGARIDVAVTVDVAQIDSVMGDPGRSQGDSTTCWRIVVRAPDPDDVADHRRIDCPDPLVPGSPAPSPMPSLGPDDAETVLRVLDDLPDGASPSDAEAALRVAFPAVDVVRAERSADELVAAVGIVDARDCVVGVRPDGEAAQRFIGFDRILIEPGELGCVPGLYLSPVTTH